MTGAETPPAPLRTLVTGAAGGIGAAVAAALRGRGDHVVGLDRVDDVDIIGVDLADDRRRVEVVEQVIRTWGGIDVLVNVAGVFAPGGVTDSDPSDWRPVWAVDLEAPLHLMRLCAPTMVAQGFGRIVNVTSVHARSGSPGCLAYDVAKAGLEAGTRSAAIDLGRSGVLVNAVAPGFVRTAMSTLADGTDETESAPFVATYVDGGKLPLGRGARAGEIAPAVLFLTARENTYVTGSVVTVDGGLTATF
ncbi:SDR family NAD(P)-dependent oxidoreductase [Pseudactinotalea suaedae]|uniref:SDR family NAD(P)-dependent oxidoreductase n=1 Tax=Pseudactinotalea suaedae TaxID=1524924 RepID=UPI001390B7C4|nr:SDR family oxidoreductase [Pseudactinotalea suaedae]